MKKFLPFLMVLLLAACSLDINMSPSVLPQTLPVSAETPTPALLPPTPLLATATLALTATPTPAGENLDILSFMMMDEQTGWALTGEAFLRTENGGQTWQELAPPGLAAVDGASFYARSAQSAWLLLPDGQLFRTADGGQTWQTSSVPFQGGILQFLDDQAGFASSVLGVGAGNSYIAIYGTEDGGQTWRQVFAHEPGEQASLPGGGQKSGIAYRDAQNGWVTGNIPMDNFAYFYRTRDGGASWEVQDIPVVQISGGAFVETQPPVFFSETDGLMLTRYVGIDPFVNYTVIYKTTDGGETWQPGAAAPTYAPVSMLDMDHVWVWGLFEQETQPGLLISVDGGQGWASIPAAPNLAGEVISLQFVSRQVGFALRGAVYPSTSLYVTYDGGANWSLLIP